MHRSLWANDSLVRTVTKTDKAVPFSTPSLFQASSSRSLGDSNAGIVLTDRCFANVPMTLEHFYSLSRLNWVNTSFFNWNWRRRPNMIGKWHEKERRKYNIFSPFDQTLCRTTFHFSYSSSDFTMFTDVLWQTWELQETDLNCTHRTQQKRTHTSFVTFLFS